ncbi:MAG: DNA-3-methyladenine glycosylase [Candidatus Bathyarchaeia archaeon]
MNSKVLYGKIVETEAYYGEDNPASKAYKGKKKFNTPMF